MPYATVAKKLYPTKNGEGFLPEQAVLSDRIGYTGKLKALKKEAPLAGLDAYFKSEESRMKSKTG